MSSGFGLKGTEGRCFRLWKDYSECMSSTNELKKCEPLRADYFECLFRKKEIERAKAAAEAANHSHGSGHGGH
jgi:hypothetical protein